MPRRDRDQSFTRLRHGFREHLRYFAASLPALSVYNLALMARDHATGEFSMFHEDIAEECNLSLVQVRKALAWLRHGTDCACERCGRLDPFRDRPRYLELVRAASRGRPPVYRVLRDDSLSLARRAAERAGQMSLIQGGRA